MTVAVLDKQSAVAVTLPALPSLETSNGLSGVGGVLGTSKVGGRSSLLLVRKTFRRIWAGR